MSRTIDEILTDINSTVSGALKYPKAIFYNQVSLQEKNDKTFPMINKGNGRGAAISLNSKYALQSYHRVLESETETDWTRGKGKYPYKMRTYVIRNVWLGSLARLQTKGYESTDDIKNAVYDAYPTILDQKELIRTTTENINKQEILDIEFAGQDTKNLALNLAVFYIDYEVKQNIKCN